MELRNIKFTFDGSSLDEIVEILEDSGILVSDDSYFDGSSYDLTNLIDINDVSDKTKKHIADDILVEHGIDIFSTDEDVKMYIEDNLRVKALFTAYFNEEESRGTYKFLEYMYYLSDQRGDMYTDELDDSFKIDIIEVAFKKFKEIKGITISSVDKH